MPWNSTENAKLCCGKCYFLTRKNVGHDWCNVLVSCAHWHYYGIYSLYRYYLLYFVCLLVTVMPIFVLHMNSCGYAITTWVVVRLSRSWHLLVCDLICSWTENSTEHTNVLWVVTFCWTECVTGWCIGSAANFVLLNICFLQNRMLHCRSLSFLQWMWLSKSLSTVYFEDLCSELIVCWCC